MKSNDHFPARAGRAPNNDSAWLGLLASTVAALALVACSGGSGDAATTAASASGAASTAAAAASAAASAPPVSVTTVRAQQRDMPVLLTATGSVTPLTSVDVKPQVSSIVTQVHIREGQFVRKGDLLFTLDSRADQANVAKARAQVARDQAALADAQRQLARSKELLAQNFISQGAVDTSRTLVESTAAALAADRAALDAASVALSNARVTAPGAGRVGAIPVSTGSAVQANQTTLVTVTQLDPIAVSFSLPQRHLGDALAGLQGGGVAVSATLPESAGTLAGRLDFVDNAVDATSGTVKVKAVFDNKGGKLWPGAFVNVATTVRTLKDAVVVPQAAIIQNARGSIVYVVADGKAAPRPVQVLYAQGEDAAVSGVKAGERIVLDGKQNLRPGASVSERAPGGGKSASGAGGADAAASAGGRASRSSVAEGPGTAAAASSAP